MSHAKMKLPEGGTGCSFDGLEYEDDGSGHVTVPVDAVGSLKDHGLTFVSAIDPEAEAAAEEADAKAKAKKGGK